MDNLAEEIVINVEFERGQTPDTLPSEVQVVPSDIQWEDLELMARIMLIFLFVYIFAIIMCT